MTGKEIKKSALHETPDNLRIVLNENSDLLEKWNSFTPIQRNEWICWITIAKKAQTKEKRLLRLQEDILDNGKKTPCCWPGCPHRRPNAKKWFK